MRPLFEVPKLSLAEVLPSAAAFQTIGDGSPILDCPPAVYDIPDGELPKRRPGAEAEACVAWSGWGCESRRKSSPSGYCVAACGSALS